MSEDGQMNIFDFPEALPVEHVSDITYIVEVWNPKEDEEDGCR